MSEHAFSVWILRMKTLKVSKYIDPKTLHAAYLSLFLRKSLWLYALHCSNWNRVCRAKTIISSSWCFWNGNIEIWKNLYSSLFYSFAWKFLRKSFETFSRILEVIGSETTNKSVTCKAFKFCRLNKVWIQIFILGILKPHCSLKFRKPQPNDK